MSLNPIEDHRRWPVDGLLESAKGHPQSLKLAYNPTVMTTQPFRPFAPSAVQGSRASLRAKENWKETESGLVQGGPSACCKFKSKCMMGPNAVKSCHLPSQSPVKVQSKAQLAQSKSDMESEFQLFLKMHRYNSTTTVIDFPKSGQTSQNKF